MPIFSNKINFRNTSLALPGPALDSSTVSAPAIAQPINTLDSVDLGAGEGTVVPVKQEIELTEKPSSTFLTDLVDTQPGISVKTTFDSYRSDFFEIYVNLKKS